jgi:hypothetical protein
VIRGATLARPGWCDQRNPKSGGKTIATNAAQPT